MFGGGGEVVAGESSVLTPAAGSEAIRVKVLCTKALLRELCTAKLCFNGTVVRLFSSYCASSF